jgi:hypothetical protein
VSDDLTHPVDAALDEAREAISRMIEAARAARHLHARAELMRHMRTTAAKVAALPLDEAVAAVSGEWMKAWGLGGEAYSGIRPHVVAFTESFCRDARGSDAATRGTMGEAVAALEAAFVAHATTLSDEMAHRSECAHRWWTLVSPPPADLPRRASVPPHDPARPFWEAGAAPHCGAPEVRAEG